MYFTTPTAEQPVEIKVQIKVLCGQYAKVRSADHGQFFLFLPYFFCCEVTGMPWLGEILQMKFNTSTREVLEVNRLA